jgi:hypothetical protein
MPTFAGMPLVTPTHIDQRADRGVSQHDNTTAISPITTIRPSSRHELLAAKGHNAVSPTACLNQDVDVIYHRFLLNAHYTHVYQVLAE